MRGMLREPAVLAAVVGAIATIGSATIGAAAQLRQANGDHATTPVVHAGDPLPAGGGMSCVLLEQQALRLAARYPDAARRYAQPGSATRLHLPALATREQIASCGDPERLLEALYG
jgi:hypothetical protein